LEKSEDTLKCKHTICVDWTKQLYNPICPLCRRDLEGPTITKEVLDIIKENKSTRGRISPIRYASPQGIRTRGSWPLRSPIRNRIMSRSRSPLRSRSRSRSRSVSSPESIGGWKTDDSPIGGSIGEYSDYARRFPRRSRSRSWRSGKIIKTLFWFDFPF
jgi:hypothetical protein